MEIDVSAASRSFGLARNAMPSPARSSIGKSLAPSPTAITWSRSTPSDWAMASSSSALRLPFTIGPRGLAPVRLSVLDLERVRIGREIDAEGAP